MKYRFEYICKLITSLKKSRNISIDINDINEKFSNTDIRYFILSMLMNNGFLFEEKFSNINWPINRNDFSAYAIWYPNSENYFFNIMEDPFNEDLIKDWSFLDDDKYFNDPVNVDSPFIEMDKESVISIFKDSEGNISGQKVMNQIRNKMFHNQFFDYNSGFALGFTEGSLEIEDEDIYAILEAYLNACTNVNIIKQLVNSNNDFQNSDTDSIKDDPIDSLNVLKINDIVSMFQFLFMTAYQNSDLRNFSKLHEAIYPFNKFLNNIDELDKAIIPTISSPEYEKAQLISLFSIIYVMSDLSQIDYSSLNLNFMTVNSRYSNESENIIRHIRNSFAHGYYYFIDDYIFIEDYKDKENKTFCAFCNINDFMNFTLSDNILGNIYKKEFSSGIKKNNS